MLIECSTTQILTWLDRWLFEQDNEYTSKNNYVPKAKSQMPTSDQNYDKYHKSTKTMINIINLSPTD